jgi:Xaa-Pro aminopeptidase
MPQLDRVIEQTKVDFSLPEILRTRELSWKALKLMAERFHVGMTEEEANKLALTTIAELGGEKNWHRPHVRFGVNTLLSFRGASEPVKLSHDDIYFIDLGPVFGGYEGDVGDTFVMGGENADPEKIRCAKDCRALFETLKAKWNAGLTGAALYDFAETEARRLGWQLNLEAAGHRVADFPHHLYYKGSLRDAGFNPRSHVWILEVQIRHPEKPFGAFYEDLLI